MSEPQQVKERVTTDRKVDVAKDMYELTDLST